MGRIRACSGGELCLHRGGFRGRMRSLVGSLLLLAAGAPALLLPGGSPVRAGDPGIQPAASSGCLTCHPQLEHGGHPFDVKPRRVLIAPGLPLDLEGRLTCGTCHEACGLETAASFAGARAPGGTRGLRSERRGLELCSECHGARRLGGEVVALRFSGPGERHAQFQPIAHPGARAQEGGGIDGATRRCLQCHDGTVGGSGDLAVPVQGRIVPSIGGRASSHPVGVPYPTRPRPGSDTSYVPRGSLDPRVVLIEGTVGCLSCHNLFGREAGLLALPNHESALCYSCHEL